MPAKIFLSGVVLAKDEAKTIGAVVDCLRKYCEEVVVVDTGSQDETQSIALAHHARVIQYSWEDNFGKARNFAAAQCAYDLVMMMDADWVLQGVGIGTLHRAMKTADGVFVDWVNKVTNEEVVSSQKRTLVYNRHKFKWHGTVHEYLAPVGTQRPSLVGVQGQIIHKHSAPTSYLRYIDAVMRGTDLAEKARLYPFYMEELLRVRDFEAVWNGYKACDFERLSAQAKVEVLEFAVGAANMIAVRDDTLLRHITRLEDTRKNLLLGEYYLRLDMVKAKDYLQQFLDSELDPHVVALNKYRYVDYPRMLMKKADSH